MRTTGRLIQRIFRSALAASALLVCLAHDTLSAATRPTRDTVGLGPIDVPAGESTVEWSLSIPDGGMLHGVSVTIHAPNGRLPGGTPVWNVALPGAAFTLRLEPRSGLSHAAELPRPLGLRVSSTESIVLRARFRSPAPVTLRIDVTLEYEPLDGPLSRIAVLPVDLPLSGNSDDVWVAPVDGRLMVLAGLSGAGNGQLVLEDAETGAVLWHQKLQRDTGEGFAGTADIVRVGAAVRAGHGYRVRFDGTVTAARHGVQALLAPVRASATLALRD